MATRRLIAKGGTTVPVIVKVCDVGHKTDMGPHIEAWEMKHDEFRECPECGSEDTDFQIGTRPATAR